LSFKDVLKGSSITYYTDSQNAASILLKGSKVHELQSLALTIFESCAKNDTEIHTVWIPREQNTQADYVSRIIDIDDWAIYTEFFQFIDELWDPHSVDRFASSNNAKTKLFNSLYWNPGFLEVNSFNSDRSQDVNWLVPPVTLASSAISHLVKCKAKGTLIVPKWTSSPFWPLIFEDGLEYKPYVTVVLESTETEIILEAGMNVNSISTRGDFKGNLLAIRLDASIS